MPSTNKSEILHLFSPELAWEHKIVPHTLDESTLTVLIAVTSFRIELVEELEIITGYKIVLLQTSEEAVQQLLTRNYRKKANDSFSIVSNSNDDFIHELVIEAKSLNSSDIHIESYSEIKRIRLRIDGKLIERYRLTSDQYLSFINKIKIKSQLDIAEKRLPQDGRMRISENGSHIDIRVSILPSLFGEKVVLRLLNNDAASINLNTIGLSESQLGMFERTLKKPHGLILISGPTGSGKTTTLYATMKLLNSEHNNILTIEDPIEYTLDGINQVQLKENIGLTFASALKTFLRQDPDIIMLGEIRDSETAQMAIRAALTGHLVLSTIHTNSAWSTIARLVDMGVPNFLISNTINLTAAQRLVRKLCVHCKEKETKIYNDTTSISIFGHSSTHFIAKGCEDCFYTGYSGRVAIFEIIPVDMELSSLIKDNIQDVSEQLKGKGISTLKDSAVELVRNGVTSIDEVYSILLNH